METGMFFQLTALLKRLVASFISTLKRNMKQLKQLLVKKYVLGTTLEKVDCAAYMYKVTYKT